MYTGKKRPSVHPPHARRMGGVTLIELMMVITVAAILIAVGIPSYRNITTSYRIAGEVNGLLGDLQFARAEAIKEGQSVMICISSNGTSCDGTSHSWQNGWIVFPVDAANPGVPPSNDAIVRVQQAFTGTDTFGNGTTSSVTFNRDGLVVGLTGMAGDNNAYLALHDSTSNVYYTRCLQISTVGAMQVTQHSSNGSCT